ncbi:Glycosyltransferase involved in cell wall bisynthesis [Chitinophaga jiangningensis]|uniref:Glycosyltransferase involved in cell wall bisynthesis n=1 Tax=Chitinophaga jiangningensis TaxID=1419482 RepID=A0A1M7A817_9BACT|nr:glycosyltransferase [Chitinophaga jiangningensis]SHL38853.1 Glycosyltransferase involved in cell wall bisynthesis [Chitinophaga jiangningensis]
MRFHIPGIPHTVTSQLYISCAYTQKVYKLCAMLTRLGHEVYHYGCEGSNPVCTEHVDVVSESLRQQHYATNFHTEQFRFDTKDQYHQTFYQETVAAVKARQQPKDFLLCAWGWGHEPIAKAFGEDMMVVESGVGYESIFARYRVFESYTWMAHVYGLHQIRNGNWYDAVIPNFFDPEDFTFSDQKEDWYLYLGRITHRKGVDVAVQTTREIGARLLIAGQGTLENEQEKIFIRDSHVEHVGFADVATRKALLSKARAVFMPTYYLEPFGGVSIEAAMSGTPVISSDWGVFGENILHGITGYRCRTFDQFCRAAENIDAINPEACRSWAMENFSVDRVALMYQEYFNMLYDLWDKGWYQRTPERTDLDWLRRSYPPQESIVMP